MLSIEFLQYAILFFICAILIKFLNKRQFIVVMIEIKEEELKYLLKCGFWEIGWTFEDLDGLADWKENTQIF